MLFKDGDASSDFTEHMWLQLFQVTIYTIVRCVLLSAVIIPPANWCNWCLLKLIGS